MIGEKFGRLHVSAYLGRREYGPTYLCICDCGKESTVYANDLKTRHTTSCGCSRTKHGKSYSKEYNLWVMMKQRCSNPNNPNYSYYGGRGITVCERWLKFENFLEDMGECPEGLQIDRVDNNGNYEPGNCEWTSRKENMNNRSCTILLTARGITHNLVEWSNITGIPYSPLFRRYKKGWDPERILNQPLQTELRKA